MYSNMAILFNYKTQNYVIDYDCIVGERYIGDATEKGIKIVGNPDRIICTYRTDKNKEEVFREVHRFVIDCNSKKRSELFEQERKISLLIDGLTNKTNK